MRNKLLYFTSFYIALVLLLASCRKSVNAESSNSQGTNANKSLTGNNLSFDFLPSSTTNQIVVHENYSLSYNEKYEQAEWVAYRLQEKHLLNNNFKRPFFIEDPKVISRSSDWRNYKNSGFDKGHLCPAGDMKFSKQAFNDTFFTSNISPQLHDFNDGVWNRLEQKVRYWASKYGEIYVVTGGVLQNGLKTIGKEKIAVPNYFYKVLIYKSNGNFHMIGFLVPHQDSDLPLYKFVVPVDKIEQITKIDFFPEMGDSIENELEKSNNYKEWSFN